MKFLPIGKWIRNRRVADRLKHWLKEGSSPEKLALSIALGVVIGTFPLFGIPTLLCGLAAAIWRLNFPVLQLVNSLMYPVQIALLWPFAWFGGVLFGVEGLSHRWTTLAGALELALHSTVAWLCFAVPAVLIIYAATRHFLLWYHRRSA